MSDLATLDQAKAHLGVPLALTDNDLDIRLKLSQASHTILTFLGGQGDPAWDSDSVPGQVQSAVLLLLTHLYEHRGDSLDTDEALWMAIRRLVRRDPPVA